MNKRVKIALRALPALVVGGALFFAAVRPTVVEATVPGVNTNINVDGSGAEGNGHSGQSSFGLGSWITRNGKYVVFNSKASNLVSSDTNAKQDVFMRDLSQSAPTRISVSTAGVQADNDSDVRAVSETGRYVVFRSASTNLIDGQTYSGATWRVFLRDMKNNTTTLVPYGGGAYGVVTGISNDGRFMLYETINSYNHIYLYDIAANTNTQLDAPVSGSPQSINAARSALSCDGSLAVFESAASNLVSGDTNSYADVFIVDIRNGLKVSRLTSAGDAESGSPNISCNGHYITFSSKASTFTSGISGTTTGHYYRYDRINESFELIDKTTSGTVGIGGGVSARMMDVSDKGDVVFLYCGYMTNPGCGPGQMYFRNVEAGTTEMLSVDSSGNRAGTTYSPSTSGVGQATITSDGKLAAIQLGQSNTLLGGANTYTAVITSQTGRP